MEKGRVKWSEFERVGEKNCPFDAKKVCPVT